MATTTIPDYPRGITFEQVWAALMETRERQEATDRQLQETSRELKEGARELREAQRETYKQMKMTDKKIGDLGNRFGELAEHLVAPNITEKFQDCGFYFEHISQSHVIRNAERRCVAEIDLLLENGDTVMAVEVKAKPNQEDVKEHISRMEVLRQRADVRNDTRKFQGAIAGAIMSEAVRNYAHKMGFYVIEQTGDTVKITIPENFKPREW